MNNKKIKMINQLKPILLNNNQLGFFIYKILKHDAYLELINNRKFCKAYSGKRCFVIGNGPSLKTEDLSVLKNEYTFTVNQFSRYSDCNKVHTNFHLWVDPNFFNLDLNRKSDIELLESMKNITADNSEVEVFYPVAQQSFVEKYKLDKTLNINYFDSKIPFQKNMNREIDFTKFVPDFGTVVQYAIVLAIYMGFSEIYMLGCDNTGLITTIKSALKSNDDTDYAYELTENEKERLQNLLAVNTLEEYTKSYLNTLILYRKLFNYCTKRGVKLVNCSSSTVIDSIPRARLTNIY